LEADGPPRTLLGYAWLFSLWAAAQAQRSASKGRLSWGQQGYSILSQYPAILDIATSLSLNKLFGFQSPSIKK
jgi:hypothetical protein